MTEQRKQEAEEAAILQIIQTYYPPLSEDATWNMLCEIKALMDNTYLAACEKCEGEIERLRKEIKIADNLIRTIPLPGRNNGAFGNNIYLPGYDEALGAYQKQFKTHNNEHGNKG